MRQGPGGDVLHTACAGACCITARGQTEPSTHGAERRAPKGCGVVTVSENSALSFKSALPLQERCNGGCCDGLEE